MEKEQYKKFFEEIGLSKGIANVKKFEQDIIIPEIIKAKKEVFDDIDEMLGIKWDDDSQMNIFYKSIKQRHLSTLQK